MQRGRNKADVTLHANAALETSRAAPGSDKVDGLGHGTLLWRAMPTRFDVARLPAGPQLQRGQAFQFCADITHATRDHQPGICA